MAITPTLEEVQKAILEVINKKVEEALQEAIEEAQVSVAKKIRESTAQIAANVLSFYDFRMDEKRMIITINTENMKWR